MTDSAARVDPHVTVIMPVRNEEDAIASSLGSVLEQRYPPERLEVLVVDGMSTDRTRDVVRTTVEDVAGRHGRIADVHVLDNPALYVPEALNIGIEHARGEVVAIVSGHCILQPSYIRTCVDKLAETGADNVGGLQVAEGTEPVAAAVAIAQSSPFGVGSARFRYSRTPGWVDTVYLGAYRREVFDRLGGFDVELRRDQDDEFNFRLVQSGGRIWLEPSLRTTYRCRPSFAALWTQYYEYGLYKVRVMQKRRGVASWRHLVPAAFVTAIAGTTVTAAVARRPSIALSVIGPYVVASSVVSAYASRRRWSLFPLVPIAFATLHVAYGVGYLVGFWRWKSGFRY